MDIAPTASVTKTGNVLIILVIALAAIWLVNNVSFFNRVVRPRTTTTAA